MACAAPIACSTRYVTSCWGDSNRSQRDQKKTILLIFRAPLYLSFEYRDSIASIFASRAM